jgi:hypothetical protein
MDCIQIISYPDLCPHKESEWYLRICHQLREIVYGLTSITYLARLELLTYQPLIQNGRNLRG